MPTLNKDELPHNAKVYAFFCGYCQTLAFARTRKTIYCSDLCRQNAYQKRKRNPLIKTIVYYSDAIGYHQIDPDEDKKIFVFKQTNDITQYVLWRTDVCLQSAALENLPLTHPLIIDEYTIRRTARKLWTVELILK